MKKKTSLSKVSIILVVIVFMLSCSTSKKTTKAKITDFSGNYEWVVEQPQNNVSGTMNLKKTESGYTGKMDTRGNILIMEDIKVENNRMTWVAVIPEMDLSYSIVFEGGNFEGTMYVADITLKITGRKIK
ncbi:hypothetical protein ACFLTI_00915 [Bacteroidota bacterium]